MNQVSIEGVNECDGITKKDVDVELWHKIVLDTLEKMMVNLLEEMPRGRKYYF